MEFEIEDRPQVVEALPMNLAYRSGDDRRHRYVAPRRPDLRDQAVLIPDQEYGS